MEFKTLANVELDDLLAVFNLSFSDYIVPFHLTKEILAAKIIAEKLDMNISVGAFEEGKLVSFILQSEKLENGQKIIYNGGTGVVPESRGKGLVRKMYDFIIPALKERGADVLLLEVIEGNTAAIRAYENLGFSIVRKLLCFKGNINSGAENATITIKEMENFQWDNLLSFWDIEPSWQGSVYVLNPMPENYQALGAYSDENLVGYIIYNPGARRVLQIAVHKDYRKQGIGSGLFTAIADGQPVAINNVDDTSKETDKFLDKKIGLQNWLSQFEMTRSI
ncbi:GNAT family N-acetyltransferase [Chryseobacterium jejuense]|uniref:Acetyltransferase (GNAT) domain-containing protein n=1 Tax=Chryseobacterium jejuense TaxID=445960 RepID=A0A2X2Z709_CHRJE|nr:GNAT family N-acetyltransferase [Chryseobacterium jejuense]SDJ55230.1 Acetyltransferase (GNAT) domain-containing protein [Chryseobacterium jejuense]SQB46230.1 ribosomal-protein-alanine N-acetyltransferase [Chryseobacterium jejuense]